jgi:hypothetical protein
VSIDSDRAHYSTCTDSWKCSQRAVAHASKCLVSFEHGQEKIRFGTIACSYPEDVERVAWDHRVRSNVGILICNLHGRLQTHVSDYIDSRRRSSNLDKDRLKVWNSFSGVRLNFQSITIDPCGDDITIKPPFTVMYREQRRESLRNGNFQSNRPGQRKIYEHSQDLHVFL